MAKLIVVSVGFLVIFIYLSLVLDSLSTLNQNLSIKAEQISREITTLSGKVDLLRTDFQEIEFEEYNPADFIEAIPIDY